MQLVQRKASCFDRLLAAVLTLSLSGIGGGLAQASSGGAQASFAEIRGNILAADGLTAISGATVKAANLDTRTIYSSAITTQDGSYKLAGLPAGSYDLAVETPQGLFVADHLVAANAGKSTLVSLALKPESRDVQGPQEGRGEEKKPEEAKPEGEEKKDEPPAEPEPEAEKKKKSGPGFWRSPGGAAISIIIGAALIAAAANSAADDSKDDDQMTPSLAPQPPQ